MKIRNLKEYLNETANELTDVQLSFLDWCVMGKWKLNEKGEVDVDGWVSFQGFINHPPITSIPVTFGNVTGSFLCQRNEKLLTLEGAPHTIGGDFHCTGCCKLESLVGAPDTTGIFDCSNCVALTDLVGSPRRVKNFYCKNCKSLTSLEGIPDHIEDTFDCTDCENLKSYKGIPHDVPNIEVSFCKSISKEEKEEFTDKFLERISQKSLSFFRKWLKSGLTFEEFKKKHRGQISSRDIIL